MAFPDNLADIARAFEADSLNRSFASPGYQKFPGGLLIQWGAVPTTSAGATSTINFPVAFSALYSAVATPASVPGATPISLGIDSTTSLAQLKINNHSAISQGGFWIAVGKS